MAQKREDVEADEHQQAGQEGVEEIERRRAHQEREEEQAAIDAAHRQRAMERLVDERYDGRCCMSDLLTCSCFDRCAQNNQVRNWPANSASPPPNTMPEICRFAPPSPNMNISPPMTMATSASDRASGPVNVSARLFAARSHGLGEHAGRDQHRGAEHPCGPLKQLSDRSSGVTATKMSRHETLLRPHGDDVTITRMNGADLVTTIKRGLTPSRVASPVRSRVTPTRTRTPGRCRREPARSPCSHRESPACPDARNCERRDLSGASSPDRQWRSAVADDRRTRLSGYDATYRK